MAINASAELSVLQAVAQFLTYAVMAVFAENAVFFRALGVSRLNKLVNDDINYVMAFYIFDFVLVLIGVVVYFRNRSLDKSGSTGAE